MKKFLLVTTAAIALGAAPAVAADLPAQTYSRAPAIVAPIYDWSGFYIGINGGGGFSHNCWDPQRRFRAGGPSDSKAVTMRAGYRRWTDRLPLAERGIGLRFGSAGQLG